MKARWISAVVSTAALTVGLALPATAAFADGNGNAGILSALSGNDVNAPVSAPVDLCGVALGILGGANAGCQGGADSATVINDGTNGDGNGNAGVASIGSGNNVNAPVSTPVNVCGVAAGVGGFANAGCKGGSHTATVIKGSNNGSGNGNAGVAAIGSGNNVNAPVSAPVNVCGVAAGVLGFANAGCEGGAGSLTLIN